MTFTKECTVLNQDMVSRAIHKLVHLIKRNCRLTDTILVGIKTGGVHIAERIRAILAEQEGIHLPGGSLDITLYRDDLSRIDYYPSVGPSSLPNVTDKIVVLIDDVLFTGRTVRAALTEILDIGRPQRIYLAILVDRGHRELPICPDFTGATLTTEREENVQVYLKEFDAGNQDRVTLQSP